MKNLYVLAVAIENVSCEKVESLFGRKVTPLEIAKELKISIYDFKLFPLVDWVSAYNLEDIDSYKWITIVKRVW